MHENVQEMTPRHIEKACFKHYPDLLWKYDRLAIVDGYHGLRHNKPIPVGLWSKSELQAIPDTAVGSNGQADDESFQRARQRVLAMKSELSHAQIGEKNQSSPGERGGCISNDDGSRSEIPNVHGTSDNHGHNEQGRLTTSTWRQQRASQRNETTKPNGDPTRVYWCLRTGTTRRCRNSV